MRISDWSSDVCSSDLVGRPGHGLLAGAALERAAESELQALEFIVVALAHRERVADRDRPDRRAPHQRDAGGHAQLVGIEGVDVLEHVSEVDERGDARGRRSEEHTSELQSLMRNSYAVFCLKKKNNTTRRNSK